MAEMVSEEEKKRMAAEALLQAAIDQGVYMPPEKKELGPSNVPALNLPIGALPTDKRNQFAQNELDLPTYTDNFGQNYTVGAAEDQRTGREKIVDTYESIPPLSDWRAPTAEELKAFGVAAAGSAWDVVDTPAKAARGEQVSYGDVADVAGMMPVGGLVAAGGDMSFDPETLRMFIGPRAKNANLDAMDRAIDMRMNGDSPEDIFKETMWMMGPDGKWRQEVSDASFQLTPELSSDVRMGRTNQLIVNNEDSPLISNKPNTYERNYSDEVDVNLKPPIEDSGLKGTHRPAYGYTPARIDVFSADPKEVETTLLHELQHAVQSQEGFSQGSSSSTTARLHNDFLNQLPTGHKKYVLGQTSLSRVMDEMLSVDTEMEAVKNGTRGWSTTDSGSSLLPELEAEYDHLAKQYVRLQEKLDAFEKEFPKSAEALYPINYFLQSSPERNYHYNAGEIEARTTQERRYMTLDERRANPPDLNAGGFPGVWDENSLLSKMRTAVSAALEEEGRSADDAYSHMLNN